MDDHAEDRQKEEQALRLPVGIFVYQSRPPWQFALLQVKIAVRGSLFANFCLAVLQSTSSMHLRSSTPTHHPTSVCCYILGIAVVARNWH